MFTSQPLAAPCTGIREEERWREGEREREKTDRCRRKNLSLFNDHKQRKRTGEERGGQEVRSGEKTIEKQRKGGSEREIEMEGEKERERARCTEGRVEGARDGGREGGRKRDTAQGRGRGRKRERLCRRSEEKKAQGH